MLIHRGFVPLDTAGRKGSRWGRRVCGLGREVEVTVRSYTVSGLKVRQLSFNTSIADGCDLGPSKTMWPRARLQPRFPSTLPSHFPWRSAPYRARQVGKSMMAFKPQLRGTPSVLQGCVFIHYTSRASRSEEDSGLPQRRLDI